MFLWQVLHGRLMTNVERVVRHFASYDICPLCLNKLESIVHMLQDCSNVSELWKHIIGFPMWNRSSALSLEQWLHMNLRGKIHDGVARDWDTCFAVTIWWMWKYGEIVMYPKVKL